jgi:hypothetical protein
MNNVFEILKYNGIPYYELKNEEIKRDMEFFFYHSLIQTNSIYLNQSVDNGILILHFQKI